MRRGTGKVKGFVAAGSAKIKGYAFSPHHVEE
jgi:hypothetical protein